MNARVLIADDEQHICMELEHILKQEEQIDVVSICSSGDEALQAIIKLKPDIVFLDIAMPGIDGISLGHYLKNIKQPPNIIYLTAYDQYAIEAIKVGAKGYVLKPFSDEDIMEALRAALNSVSESERPRQEQGDFSFRRVCGTLNGGIILIDQQDILYAYANDRQVFLRANGVDYLCKYSLAELEMKLDPNLFFRCHRNYIVNLYKIKQVYTWFNGSYLLIMNDSQKTEIPISRSKIKSIKEMLDI